MLFQLVENTKDVIVFTDDKFVINPDFNHLTHTWQYSPYLDNSTTFASLLVGNKTLLDVCPEQLKPKFKNIISKPITTKNIQALEIARHKILYEYNIWPTIKNIINN